MAKEIIVPPLGESVTEATVARWLKKVGASVEMDEPLVELETDKITLEVNAASAGVLSHIEADEGETVKVGALLGKLSEEKGQGKEDRGSSAQDSENSPEKDVGAQGDEGKKPGKESPGTKDEEASHGSSDITFGPGVAKLLREENLDPRDVLGSESGRLRKDDVLDYLDKKRDKKPTQEKAETPRTSQSSQESKDTEASRPGNSSDQTQGEDTKERRVPMSRMRQKIAEHLKSAQNTAAILTTFNEIDMSAVMATRAQHKDAFEKKHGVKLGFMSFFTKAAAHALREFPEVNAEIQGSEIVYHDYCHMGIAVSTPQGLVVPVLKDAHRLGFADIEKGIADLGTRAREGKLTLQELTGGTFTITNGGIFGSLLSTPIINAPQSGILGMHKIQERPMAIKGAIEIRPMMYVALSYDHRLIDGRGAVSFLVRIKDLLETPERLLLDV